MGSRPETPSGAPRALPHGSTPASYHLRCPLNQLLRVKYREAVDKRL